MRSSSARETDPWGNLDRSDIRARRFEDTAPGDWSASTHSTFAQPSRRAPPPRRRGRGLVVFVLGLLAVAVSGLAFALRA